MDIKINDGFNIVYAEKCGRPKAIFLNNRQEVINFFMENLTNIELLTINDIIIDKNKLVNDNKLLGRYLKLKRFEKL